MRDPFYCLEALNRCPMIGEKQCRHAEPEEYSNNLINETGLYLLQQAHDPLIGWGHRGLRVRGAVFFPAIRG